MLRLKIFLFIIAVVSATSALSAGQNIDMTQEGPLIVCGASKGNGYYFKDKIWNPDGPSWEEDGITNGKIVLVRLGEEWDIAFDDTIGANSYRKDGAKVIFLGARDRLLRIGAFHSNYSDIYVFDFENREVVWTSSKLGPFSPKVTILRADCE